jgi:hypothetical protein
MIIVVLIVGFAVNAWLLILLHRQGVRKQLQWFALYVSWQLLLISIQLMASIIIPRLYVAVYWWTETIEVVLIVAAVRESFVRIFEGFTSKPGFRWTVWAAIVAVVAYSAWKAIYAPPVQSNRLAAFVIGAEFAFRCGIVAIWFLTTMWSFFLEEPINTREDAVVTGFAIASIAFLATTVIASVFGTRYLFFRKYLPSVGYFMAVFWWIRVFSRPNKQTTLKDLGMEPEDVQKELRLYGNTGERIMKEK